MRLSSVGESSFIMEHEEMKNYQQNLELHLACLDPKDGQKIHDVNRFKTSLGENYLQYNYYWTVLP